MPAYPFDVLAGAQAVRAIVVAFARVDPLAQRTHLHDVRAAARRSDPIVRERAMFPIECAYLVDLGAAAPLPPLDLVLVRRDPPPECRGPILRPVPAAGRRPFPSAASCPRLELDRGSARDEQHHALAAAAHLAVVEVDPDHRIRAPGLRLAPRARRGRSGAPLATPSDAFRSGPPTMSRSPPSKSLKTLMPRTHSAATTPSDSRISRPGTVKVVVRCMAGMGISDSGS